MLAKADRLAFDVFANFSLSFLTGALLIVSYYDKVGTYALAITQTITYAGATFAGVNALYTVHEIFFVIPAEESIYEVPAPVWIH